MFKLESIGTAALVSAIISGGISYYSANVTDQNSKARGARLEQIVRFATSNDAFMSSASGYITALAYNKDVKPLRETLGTEVNKQFSESEKLRIFFTSPDVNEGVKKYQDDLIAFYKVIQTSPSTAGIGVWTVQFDKVNNARISLTEQLKKSAGVTL